MNQYYNSSSTSYELRLERDSYYDLQYNIENAINKLKEVPEELTDARTYLKESFTINDESIDKNKIKKYCEKTETYIDKLYEHISKIEREIDELTEAIIQKEIDEESGEQ